MPTFTQASTTPKFKKLVASLDAMEIPTAKRGYASAKLGATAPAEVDLCGVWRVAKPIVETASKILKLIPFGWGKKIAAGLEYLASALNAYCPSVGGPQ